MRGLQNVAICHWQTNPDAGGRSACRDDKAWRLSSSSLSRSHLILISRLRVRSRVIGTQSIGTLNRVTMAESQVLLTILTSLCTFLLCYICFPEIAASRNRRRAAVGDGENASLYLPPKTHGGIVSQSQDAARHESETPELQPGLVEESASRETAATPAEQISNNPDKVQRRKTSVSIYFWGFILFEL
jgi:hypothetical protein